MLKIKYVLTFISLYLSVKIRENVIKLMNMKKDVADVEMRRMYGKVWKSNC